MPTKKRKQAGAAPKRKAKARVPGVEGVRRSPRAKSTGVTSALSGMMKRLEAARRKDEAKARREQVREAARQARAAFFQRILDEPARPSRPSFPPALKKARRKKKVTR